MIHRVLATVLLLVPFGVAGAASPPACTDGVFSVIGRPLVPTRGFELPDLVTFAEGTVAIASGCAPAPVDILLTPRGTVVRATWTECGSLRRVRLRARIRPSCRALSGWFLASGVKRPFVAADCGGDRCRRPACDTNADCGESAYCRKTVGACDGRGACRPRAGACTADLNPVCGCDGRSYQNACEAGREGASVAHAGPCDACDAESCPATCDATEDCGADQFCARASGHCGERGVCRARPGACTKEYVPVCGCDGETYANACDAGASGASVAHAGSCRKTCAGIAGIPCSDGEMCDLFPGECSIVDGQGRCLAKPAGFCVQVYEPVCGCDGTTYANDCERLLAGAQAAHAGECPRDPDGPRGPFSPR